MSLEQVPPKDPLIDAAEARGGRIGFIATIARPFKRLAERWHRRRVQKHIDEVHHDRLRVGAKDK